MKAFWNEWREGAIYTAMIAVALVGAAMISGILATVASEARDYLLSNPIPDERFQWLLFGGLMILFAPYLLGRVVIHLASERQGA